jgi:Arc/MetJ family transcription regulator
VVRTTLDIDDDVLAAAKAIARAQRKTAGAVVSELARKGLRRPAQPGARNGVPLLPIRNPEARVSLETVKALRDEAS